MKVIDSPIRAPKRPSYPGCGALKPTENGCLHLATHHPYVYPLRHFHLSLALTILSKYPKMARICGRSVKSWKKGELRKIAGILMVRGRSLLDTDTKEQLFEKLKEAEAKRPISRAQEEAIQNIKRRDGRVEAALGDTSHAKVRSSSSQTGFRQILKATLATNPRSEIATTGDLQQQRAGDKRRRKQAAEPTTKRNTGESRNTGLSSRNGGRRRQPPLTTAPPSPPLGNEDLNDESAAPVSARAIKRQKVDSSLEPASSEHGAPISGTRYADPVAAQGQHSNPAGGRNPYRRPAISAQPSVPLANHLDAALTVSAEPLLRECIVCSEQIIVTNDDDPNITATCIHARNVCAECLQQTLQGQFETRGWENFTCPSCRQPFQHYDMKLWAPADLFERYDSHLASKAMVSDEFIIICGIPDCGGAGMCNPTEDSWVTCNVCRHRTCLGCRGEYHTGKTCREFREELDRNLQTARRNREKEQEEQATVEHLRDRVYKNCPNIGCGVVIEKDHGCDHMTCFNCNNHFCWRCFAPYHEIWRVGNSAHQKSCPHYRP